MMKFDLHAHSTHSDGKDTPVELVNKLSTHNDIFTITDHNIITAHDNVKCSFTGVELNTNINELAVETLYYKYDLEKAKECPFIGLEHQMSLQSELLELYKYKASKVGLRFSKGLSIKGSEYSSCVIYKELKQYPENICILGKKAMQSSGDFYRACNSNKTFPLYLQELTTSFPTIQDLLELQCNAGGYLFLAHPFLYPFTDFERNSLICECFKSFDGVEALHTTASVQQQQLIVETAVAIGSFISGGTDHHGDNDKWEYTTTEYNRLGWDFNFGNTTDWIL